MTCFVDDEVPQLGWSQRVVDVLPNIRVPADDVNLRAVTRFARDAFNLDGLVRDLRNLEFKKFADEIGMAARKNDLRAMQRVLDAQGVRANAVAGLVFLRGHALPAGHDAFNFAEINDHITAFEAAHGTGKDIAGATLELLEHHVLFDLANALEHCLLGGLCGDAAKILWGDLNLDVFTKLDVRKTASGVRQ